MTRRLYCEALVHVPALGGFIMTLEYVLNHKVALMCPLSICTMPRRLNSVFRTCTVTKRLYNDP